MKQNKVLYKAIDLEFAASSCRIYSQSLLQSCNDLYSELIISIRNKAEKSIIKIATDYLQKQKLAKISDCTSDLCNEIKTISKEPKNNEKLMSMFQTMYDANVLLSMSK